MWLTGRLASDHKSIADFRRDNGPGISRVCVQFVEICRRIGTLKGDCVATHLIVTCEVTNQVHDRDVLAPMATATKKVLARDDLHVLADKGYLSSREILTCFETGITTTVPRPETSGKNGKGIYVKADFSYEPDADVYRCPAGEALSYRYTTEEDGLQFRRYWTSECATCPIKSRWTGKERRIIRWEHEHLIGKGRSGCAARQSR